MGGEVRDRGKASTLALATGFRSGDEFGQLSLLKCGRIEVMEWRDDRHANRLGIYRATRPPLDAADEPVARAAMDSLLDDRGDADGRRVALVRTRRDAYGLRRTAKIRRRGRGGIFGNFWRHRIQTAKAAEPAPAALPVGAALLVASAAAGQILLSIRAHHDGVFDCASGQLFLSSAGGNAVFRSVQHSSVSHRAGYALPQRCARRNRAGHSAGLRGDNSVRFVRLGLIV